MPRLYARRLDLDKPAAMRSLFQRYDENMPGGYGWCSVHCINPEHLDTEESASVNGIEGAYRCHACGLKGDAYAIIQQIESVDFKEALRLLGGGGHLDHANREGDRALGDKSKGRMTWL